MACGCGKRAERMTSAEANALIAQSAAYDEQVAALQARVSPQEALTASAANAVGNADSNASALR